MEVKAIINIDVISIYTGEILEQFEQVWLGDYEKIYNNIASRYTINKTEREKDLRIVFVEA